MQNLSSLGIGLSLVSGFLFLALVAELYYLFRWKKNRANRGSSAEDLFLPLFCWRKPSSMSSAAINPQEISIPLKPIEEDDDTVAPELMRLQGLAGLPRFLFTIKEETREELESEDGRSRKGSSLSDLFVASSTPLLTPLASPPFFAPPLTAMFDSSSEEELIKMWSSPPPKFKFLQDAEQKLQRKKSMEEAKTFAEEDDADCAFISVKKGRQHQQLSSSQVIPLSSSPSSFRTIP